LLWSNARGKKQTKRKSPVGSIKFLLIG
jgi:hypothetical protein